MILEFWQFLFTRDLTRNLEIENTTIWVLVNIWRLWEVIDTSFGNNVSDEKLLTAAECKNYSFGGFLSYWGKINSGLKSPPPPQPN